MKKIKFLALALTAGLLLSFAPEQDRRITVFTIGDSTMANKPLAKGALERGWGQALGAYFDSRYVVVDNHAQNGRSSKSFYDEGLWAPVYEAIRPGDYVFIQFGHNDEKPDEKRHTDPGSTYNEQLRFYVNQTREKGGIPVIFTSVVRRKFNAEGKLEETHGDYLQAARDLAAEEGVVLIDMNLSSKALVESMGPEDSKQLYMWVPKDTNLALPNGREDDTHFRALGARKMANLALDEIEQKIPALAPYIRRYDLVVAKDGSGDFLTVQEAIDAVPDYRKAGRTRIYIRNGVYQEKLVLPESKQGVTFIGEDVEKTILTYDDFAGRKNRFGENKGTSGSASFYIYGTDFHACNITFQNSAGPVGQAVAVLAAGDRLVFDNCRFLGHQDTLYPFGKQSRQLYRDCYIEGTVDFIFGAATCYFQNCEIHSKSGGYLTAASTLQGRPFGYVFSHCRLTADEGVNKVALGRPWRPYAQTVYVSCLMDSHILAEGWNNWGNPDNEKTAFYGEVDSRTMDGKRLDVSKRVSWAHKVNAKDYTIDLVLKDDDQPEWYLSTGDKF